MAKIHKINTDPIEEAISFETLFKEALEVNLFYSYSLQREHFKKASKLAQQTHWNSIFCAYLEENFPGTTIDQYKTLYTRTNFKKCVDERTSIENDVKENKRIALKKKWYPEPETIISNEKSETSWYRDPSYRVCDLLSGIEWTDDKPVPVKSGGKKKKVKISTPTLKSFISNKLNEKQKIAFNKFIQTEYNNKTEAHDMALFINCSIELECLDYRIKNGNVSATYRALQNELNVSFTQRGLNKAISRTSSKRYLDDYENHEEYLELRKKIEHITNSNK